MLSKLHPSLTPNIAVIGPLQFKSTGSARRARFIAVLLLAFVSWGATAELTHHHDTRRLDSVTDSSPSNVGVDSNSFESTEKQTNPSSSKSRAECLICQLHQNLSTTLVTHAPGVASSETKTFRAPAILTLRLSEFRSDRSGRAPPSNL